jgi:hypothetical protein
MPSALFMRAPSPIATSRSDPGSPVGLLPVSYLATCSMTSSVACVACTTPGARIDVVTAVLVLQQYA